MKEKSVVAVGLMLFIHLFFLINLKFTAWPEMTSYAYLYNNGFTLYKETFWI